MRYCFRQVSLSISGLACLLIFQPSPSLCQLLIPVDVPGAVLSATKKGNEVWIATMHGAFRYDPQQNRAVPVEGETGRVYQIALLNNELWFAAENGAFRYDPQQNLAVRVAGATGWVTAPDGRKYFQGDDVTQVALFNNEVWIAAFGGAFRYDPQQNRAVPVEGETGPVWQIDLVNSEVWLAAGRGAFRYDRQQNRAVPVEGEAEAVYQIALLNNEVWLAPKYGAFRYDPQQNRAVPVEGETGAVYQIALVNNKVWLAAGRGAFRYDPQQNRAVPVEGETEAVYQIALLNNEVWLAAKYGAFRYDPLQNRAVPVEGETGRVDQIALVGNEVWFAAQNGVFRYDPQRNRAVWVEGGTGRVTDISKFDLELSVGGVSGSLRYDPQRNRAVVKSFAEGYVFWIVPADSGVWLGNPKGAALYDPQGRISIGVNGPGSLVTRLLGSRFSLAGVASLELRYSTPFEPAKGKTKVVLASSSKELRDEEESQAWQPISKALYELTPPETTLHVSFVDDWGNVGHDVAVTRWVVPTWGFATVSLLVLATAFWLLCLGLAPYVRPCHLILMNPYVRNFGSFGVVPILLTVAAPVRRHLFRRYRREMVSGDRADWLPKAAKDYVLPESLFEATAFLESLSDSPVVVIHGQSGIGKSAFMRYLAYSCVSSLADSSPVPVLIDLSLYKGVEPKAAILAGLEKYGELTDHELVAAILDQGGFLFLFDGLNEVSEESMRQIAQFVDTGRRRNYACLTTQVPTRELLQIGTLIEVQPLQKDKVEELIRKSILEPDQLLKKFTEDAYRLCRVPLQLELLLEMWKDSRRVPETLDQLFGYALGPVLDRSRWEESGHADYPQILAEVAYRMLTERRAYRPESHELPQAVEKELTERKLLNQRGPVMEFRHDKVKAYLAFLHFKDRWRAVLTLPETVVDSNWDSMLQFYFVQQQNPVEAKVVFFLLLEKDLETAKRNFAWLQVNRPELSRDWHEAFSRAVGERVLGLTQASTLGDARQIPPVRLHQQN